MTLKSGIIFISLLSSASLSAQDQFKNQCIGDLCLGDNLDKVAKLKTAWLPESQHPSTDPRNVKEVRKAFRGLSDGDYKTLATTTNFGGSGDPNLRGFVPDPVVHVVLTTAAIAILKNATGCGGLPVHGIYKSESGHYNSILLLPDSSGRLVVVKIARRWTLNAPPEASKTQRGEIVTQQLNALYKQIEDAYGNT